MPKTKRIKVNTQEEVIITSNRSITTIDVDNPDVNEILDSIDDEDLATYIQSESTLKPEDIFSEDELSAWASENGYIKE